MQLSCPKCSMKLEVPTDPIPERGCCPSCRYVFDISPKGRVAEPKPAPAAGPGPVPSMPPAPSAASVPPIAPPPASTGGTWGGIKMRVRAFLLRREVKKLQSALDEQYARLGALCVAQRPEGLDLADDLAGLAAVQQQLQEKQTTLASLAQIKASRSVGKGLAQEFAQLQARQREFLVVLGEKAEAAEADLPAGAGHYGAIKSLRATLDTSRAELRDLEAKLAQLGFGTRTPSPPAPVGPTPPASESLWDFPKRAFGDWSTRVPMELGWLGIFLLVAFGAPWYIGEELPLHSRGRGRDDLAFMFSWQFADTLDKAEDFLEDMAEKLRDGAQRLRARARRSDDEGLEAKARDMKRMARRVESLKPPLLLDYRFLLFSGLLLTALAFIPMIHSGVKAAVSVGIVLLLLCSSGLWQPWSALAMMLSLGQGLVPSAGAISAVGWGLLLIGLADQLAAFRLRAPIVVRLVAASGVILVLAGLALPAKFGDDSWPCAVTLVKALSATMESDHPAASALLGCSVFSAAIALVVALWGIFRLALRREHSGPQAADLAPLAAIAFLLPLLGPVFLASTGTKGVIVGAFYFFVILIVYVKWLIRLAALIVGAVAEPIGRLLSPSPFAAGRSS